MRTTEFVRLIAATPIIFASVLINAAELPASFPADVPIADYMEVVNVTQVRSDLMVDLHAATESLHDVVDWFKSSLSAAGWSLDGETVTSRMAILAYSKGTRRCGVNVTNFVLDSAMQRDDKIKGVTLQLSTADAQPQDAAATASDAAGTTKDQP